MNRTFLEVLQILNEAKAVYEAVHKDLADHKLDKVEIFALVEQVLAILAKHNVSVAEMQEILKAVAPLI